MSLWVPYHEAGSQTPFRLSSSSFVDLIFFSADDLENQAQTETSRWCSWRRWDVGSCRQDSRSVAHIICVLDFCLNFLVFLASCDKCNFNSAYYYQLQIRSADEPMTTCTFILFKFGVLNWPWMLSLKSLSVSCLQPFGGIRCLIVDSRCVSCAHQWREN